MTYLKWTLYFLGLLALAIVTPLVASMLLGYFICWQEPIAGPITAITVVGYSFAAAPSHKAWGAIFGFSLGCALAYIAPDIDIYPECHAKAYQKNYIALALTYTAGLLFLGRLLFWPRQIT
ncbi:hypothetical protein [Microbulbifer sp. SSSA005]|uniref:hypothetical protein n=1 Tax=Microbulbifer sp. SSSA005 TaxID=3243378 RepID=UPI004039F51A